MIEKGRLIPPASGELHWNNKLSREQVVEIKAAIASGSRGVDIAAKYGVTNRLISEIKHGRCWAGV